jgi:hypothetical protein
VTNAGGKSHTTSTTVNVASAGRQKIYVSAAGSDSNDGLSSGSPIRSFAKAATKLRDNIEILFRRGDTFGMSGGMVVSGKDNVVIGAYGSGDRPELKWTGAMPDMWEEIISTGGGAQIAIQDLTFTTQWTGTGKVHVAGVRPGGTGVVVRRNEFIEIDDAVNANSRPHGLIVQDNVVPHLTGMAGQFMWVDGADITVVGNSVANSTRENIIRVSNSTAHQTTIPERINISHNSFTNVDRSDVDRYDYLKGTIIIQKSKYAYVGRNTVKDGWITVGPLGSADGVGDKAARTYYAVVEANKANDTTIRLHHGAEHTMVRNNVVDIDRGAAFVVEGYNSTYGRTVRDATFVNNTAINNSSSGTMLQVGSGASAIAVVNNLFVAPSLVTGSSGTAPLYVDGSSLAAFSQITNNIWGDPSKSSFAQGGINYVYDYWSNSAGYKTPTEWHAYSQVGTDYFSDVSISSTSYAPSTSSLAASVGRSYAGVFVDFYGNSRPGSGGFTVGAVEV